MSSRPPNRLRAGQARYGRPGEWDRNIDPRQWWAALTDDEKMEVMIGNAQGGWRKTTKYKDKNGNWVTETIWGSGKAGW